MVVGVPSVGANHREAEMRVLARPLVGMVLSIEASVMRCWHDIPIAVIRMAGI